MRGFDRPLKPEWIYETLKLAQPGTSPKVLYEPFKKIAPEFTGKDGQRKARTVLFRTYIYAFQQSATTIESNPLITLCQQKDFKFMKPLLLAQLILSHDILAFLTDKIIQIFDPSQDIATHVLTAKMVGIYGDLEIVKRSTRGFLKTLTDFQVLEEISTQRFRQLPKLMLEAEQVKEILKLYSIAHHSKQIHLTHLPLALFALYRTPELHTVALTYHLKDWEYIRSAGRAFLLMK